LSYRYFVRGIEGIRSHNAVDVKLAVSSADRGLRQKKTLTIVVLQGGLLYASPDGGVKTEISVDISIELAK
jgi:hypothetical protein